MAHARILVVDDEKGVVRACVRILEKHGYTVTGQTDSSVVPDLLRHSTFDLLLTDIKMPQLGGLDLLCLAKDIDPHLTVVLITGFGTMEDSIRAIQLGAQGFLLKPFEPEDLVATVEESLARRTLIRDSLRLQTLLPLLEINETLQANNGADTLIRRILSIAQRETGAARLEWHVTFTETMVIPDNAPPPRLTDAWTTIQQATEPTWIVADGHITHALTEHPNIVGARLPVFIKGELVGHLTAEAGTVAPFDPISLDLLSVLTGQLAMVMENVRLFHQTETLRAFNADVIHTMSNGLIATDEQAHITVFNPAAAKMLHLDPAAVYHQPITEAIPARLAALFQTVLQTGQPSHHQEIVVKTADHAPTPLMVSVAPLGLESAGAVGVLEDLSVIRALEAKQRRLDRLAALGEMSAVVAHEIRNPIAGIGAGFEYLTRNIAPDSPDFAGVTMVQGEIERVNRILEDILFMARPLKLKLSDEFLPDLVADILQRLQPHIQAATIETTLDVAADVPCLPLDRQRCEQVFTNLVMNAIQAMPTGGQIHISITVPDSQVVRIRLTDTGPGIPADIQAQVFEPFFTTKAKGTGLGLPVAHRIIDQHHGTITLQPLDHAGTCFEITLPRTASQ